MGDQIARRNARARQAAETAGRPTYQHQVTDFWPACTVCARPIRSIPFEPDRRCACPGVRWVSDIDGQRRIEPPPPAARPVRDGGEPT